MNDYEQGFIAGLLDSEGCLYWNRGKYPTIEIYNTNFMLLVKAQSIVGGSLFEGTGGGKKKLCAFRLTIRFPAWLDWLPQVPLVEKEYMRQEFLLWAVKQ